MAHVVSAVPCGPGMPPWSMACLAWDLCQLVISAWMCPWKLSSKCSIVLSFLQSTICPMKSWYSSLIKVIHLEVMLGVPPSLPTSSRSLHLADYARPVWFSLFIAFSWVELFATRCGSCCCFWTSAFASCLPPALSHSHFAVTGPLSSQRWTLGGYGFFGIKYSDLILYVCRYIFLVVIFSKDLWIPNG